MDYLWQTQVLCWVCLQSAGVLGEEILRGKKKSYESKMVLFLQQR